MSAVLGKGGEDVLAKLDGMPLVRCQGRLALAGWCYKPPTLGYAPAIVKMVTEAQQG